MIYNNKKHFLSSFGFISKKPEFQSEFKELSVIISCKAYNGYKKWILHKLNEKVPNMYIVDNVVTNNQSRYRRFTYRFKHLDEYNQALGIAVQVKTKINTKFGEESCIIV